MIAGNSRLPLHLFSGRLPRSRLCPSIQRRCASSSSSSSSSSLYDILGVHPTADKKAIKAQYYKLSLKYHPDHNPSDSEAQKKFVQISDAYGILSNDLKRRDYDRSEVQKRSSNIYNRRSHSSTSSSPYSKNPQYGDPFSKPRYKYDNSKFNYAEHYDMHYKDMKNMERERKKREEREEMWRRSSAFERLRSRYSLNWTVGLTLFGFVYTYWGYKKSISSS
ncbi:DnaJ domain-containing protein [Paraphysoderma sedebokerense]|nr:DnaJ domain-containing protein [Paraphysoderma sedebokerense]